MKMEKFPFYISEPVILEVKDSQWIKKGQVLKRKGIYLQAIHEKVAHDGRTKVAAIIIGREKK